LEYREFASIVYHKNKCLIICVMLSDVNLHYLTLAARCPVSGCWPSSFYFLKLIFLIIHHCKKGWEWSGETWSGGCV